MRKNDLNVQVFQNRNWRPFLRNAFKWKKYGGTATSSYSATGEFLQYIYSALVAKNHQKIWSRYLVHEFFLTDIFNDSNHGYRAALLKKHSLWLLPFCMAVASYCDYEKARRANALSIFILFNTESQDKVFAQEFWCKESDYGDSSDEDI